MNTLSESQQLPLSYAYYKMNHKLSVKFAHYIEIYEDFLAPYQGKKVCAIEIGSGRGGFLQVLHAFLGNESLVLGMDHSPAVDNFTGQKIKTITGSQEKTEDIKRLLDLAPDGFDIIIDDASHDPKHQIATFEMLYPKLKSPGIYAIEDIQLSYAPKYGGYKKPGTFIEYSKDLIDQLNGWLAEPEHTKEQKTEFSFTTHSMHFFPNIIVIKKQKADLRSPVWIGERDD